MAYEKQEAAELVIRAGHRLAESGLIARTWGNISARISDTEFVITPSGKSYEGLTPEEIVTVKIDDLSYEGDIKPSSEKGVHAAAYKHRKEIDFIIHTHQAMATAYGVLGISLSDYGDEQWKVLGDFVPCAKYAISSTKKLTSYMEEVIADCPDSNAFFMRYHGVLCLGQDYDHAFSVSSTLEGLCTQIVEKTLDDELGLKLWEEDSPNYKVPKRFLEMLGGRAGVFVNTPAVVEVSKSKEKLYPMIDDMAQIGGVDVSVVSYRPGWERRAKTALMGRSAVFIQGKGAICVAKTKEDAQAVGMVLDKNCLAHLFAEANGMHHHLAHVDALLQRAVYVGKYSKLKV